MKNILQTVSAEKGISFETLQGQPKAAAAAPLSKDGVSFKEAVKKALEGKNEQAPFAEIAAAEPKAVLPDEATGDAQLSAFVAMMAEANVTVLPFDFGQQEAGRPLEPVLMPEGSETEPILTAPITPDVPMVRPDTVTFEYLTRQANITPQEIGPKPENTLPAGNEIPQAVTAPQQAEAQQVSAAPQEVIAPQTAVAPQVVIVSQTTAIQQAAHQTNQSPQITHQTNSMAEAKGQALGKGSLYAEKVVVIKGPEITVKAAESKPSSPPEVKTEFFAAPAKAEVPLDPEKVYIKVGEGNNLNSEKLASDISEKLLSRMQPGTQQFVLELTPQDLGKILIKLVVQNGKAEIIMQCMNPKTQQLVMTSADAIRNIVEERTGLSTTVTAKEETEGYRAFDEKEERGGQSENDEQKSGKWGQAETDIFLQQLRLGLTDIVEARI